MAAVTICSDFAVIIAMNLFYYSYGGFPHSSAGKESACNVGDLGSIPGLGRSPGEGKGYPLQYSGLENSMDCIVYGAAKIWTKLSDFHFHYEPMTKEKNDLTLSSGSREN